MLGRGGESSDAEDVFQEALMIAYEKARDPEFCLTCKLSTYLFAVSKRLWYKKLQKDTRIDLQSDFPENKMAGPEEDINVYKEREQYFLKLKKAMEQLGEPCASLISAFYEEEKSMKEIAELFNYTNPENAKTQKYKCLNRLRKLYFAGQEQPVRP
jgi:RNA polymerase sigma factor (sigma-70 family)